MIRNERLLNPGDFEQVPLVPEPDLTTIYGPNPVEVFSTSFPERLPDVYPDAAELLREITCEYIEGDRGEADTVIPRRFDSSQLLVGAVHMAGLNLGMLRNSWRYHEPPHPVRVYEVVLVDYGKAYRMGDMSIRGDEI